MTIGDEILAWLAERDRPRWLSVALRMLTETTELTPAQVDTLAAIALRDGGHDAPFGDITDDAALQPGHLGTLAAGRGSVSILALAEAANVNRLAPGQELVFAETGLTVVYGDNGAGKTGYARVLKRTCGARAVGKPILGDVFKPGVGAASASCTIRYSVDGCPASCLWTDSLDAAPLLPEVAYFDRQCGDVHVEDESAVLFTPRGLALIERLAGTCDGVRDRLRRYAEETRRAAPAPLVPQEQMNTQAHATINGLKADTDVDKLKLDTPLTAAEGKELAALVEEDAKDPALVVQRCDSLVRPCLALHWSLSDLDVLLQSDQVAAWANAVQAVADADAASKLASAIAFDAEPLPYVGEQPWRDMWESVRKFSDDFAYTEVEFPDLPEGAVCPTCQQELAPEARARFLRFEEFVTNSAEWAVKEAREMLVEAERPYRAAVRSVVGAKALIATLEEPALEARVHTAIAFVETNDAFPQGDVLVQLRAGLEDALIALRQRETALAGDRRAAQALADPNAAVVRKARVADLKSREWLVGQLTAVDAYVQSLNVTESVGKAEGTCRTNAVTIFAGRVSKDEVTDRLASEFQKELSDLGVRNLPVRLGGLPPEKGVVRQKMTLDGAASTDLAPVLSEGERKAVAFCGFVAEANLRADSAGMVFDDPVTSLDHEWRVAIADRIVAEARQRQAVIFTHDIVFLVALSEAADRDGVPMKNVTIFKGTDTAGIVRDGLPWAGMNVKARIGELNDSAQRASALYNLEGLAAYEPVARSIYGRLREAWERGVEEVLLNGTVVRFGRAVKTQQLKKLSDISDADIKAVDDAMTRCSIFMTGHDDASGLQQAFPPPGTLQADIKELADWTKAIRDRR